MISMQDHFQQQNSFKHKISNLIITTYFLQEHEKFI
jgi:hypothetical protein